MKIKISILLLALVACLAFTMKQKKKRVIFFGDSITQMGVNPNGYITKLGTLLKQNNLDNKYELVGAGIGGNKVYDLYLRMDDDVLAKNPDVVVIWVGVNDVWHKQTFGTGTDPDKFERFYNAIIKKLKEKNIEVYLCTPSTIGEKTDCSNQQDGDLNYYSGIIRNIAKNNNCTLIDLRHLFMDYLKTHNPENKEKGILTVDRVHLNDAGNQFVADEMYKAINWK